MTITSYGYPGVFAPGTVWAELQRAIGNRYYVDDPSSVACVPLVGGTREVQVSAGRFGGWGVADVNDAPVNIALPTVSSGTRWFLIVARRTWGVVNTTTLVALDPGWSSLPASLPVPGSTDASFNQQPGIRDDQPLWLVPLTAGQTLPGAPVDARIIGTGNDFLAQNDIVRQYANWPGVRLVIGSVVWSRVLNTSGDALVWDANPGHMGAVAGLPKLSGASLITPGTGWSLKAFSGADLLNVAYKDGNWVHVTLHVRRTGARLTPGTSGNYSDADGTVGTLAAGWRPAGGMPWRGGVEIIGRPDTVLTGLGAIGGQGYISASGAAVVEAAGSDTFGINTNAVSGNPPHSVALTASYLYAV